MLYFVIGVSFKSHAQTAAAPGNTLKGEDASILKINNENCDFLWHTCTISNISNKDKEGFFQYPDTEKWIKKKALPIEIGTINSIVSKLF